MASQRCPLFRGAKQRTRVFGECLKQGVVHHRGVAGPRVQDPFTFVQASAEAVRALAERRACDVNEV